MRNKIFFTIALFTCLVLSGCFEDDSTLGNNVVGNISVNGIEATYTKTAYIGEKLSISPDVKSDYADEDMDYQWLLLTEKTGPTASGDTIPPLVIGTEKNLDYEVSLSPGKYQIRFIAASKTNGYKTFTTAEFMVQTNFTQGFYIMKETIDGNTELDMYNNNDEMSENLFEQTKGAALVGKPLWLGTNYNMCYINPDNDKMEATQAITITTQNKNICVCRSSDLKTAFDNNNLLFDNMSVNEQPYSIIFTGMEYQAYLSSSGIRYTQGASQWFDPNSGKFGLPIADEGASKFVTHDIPSGGAIVYWDETHHSLMATNYNLDASIMTYSNSTGSDITGNLTNFECLYMGYNFMNREGTSTTILEDKINSKRYLYLTESSFMGIYLKERKEIKEGSHLYNAQVFSTNGCTAKYIYCIDSGHLYACLYDTDDMSEQELKPEGIGEGETISFITNQFWNPKMSSGKSFNYLIVGTQKGDNYHLYMYETIGGAPQGKPVKTISGTGIVRSIRYLHPDFNAYDWMFSAYTYNIND